MFWSRWWWLLVPLLGLVEWLAHGLFSSAPPEEGDWEQLADVIKELRDDKQLVVVAPYWAEPHARRVLGDWAMPLADVARPDDERYRRAIEISILGQRSRLAAWTETNRREVDMFTLRLLDNPAPIPVKTDLVDLLDEKTASAATRKGSSEQECEWTARGHVENGALHGHPTFPKRRFQCPGGGSWHFVGVTTIEDQDYRPRRCIWAHPSRAATVVRFPKVELGERIVAYGGLPWFLERESKGAKVYLSVLVDGEQLGRMSHADGDGWKRAEFSTAPLAGETHDIEFRVRAKNPRQREFCFQADVR